ncbi:MAG TPA: type II toxin-antitoxin system MqsR family toxin [Verrucomicrobiae bacterium]|nr:type II toxin-antitoxin system MqsR family toxin [Verrucomicrobiae bacterium]
MRRRWLTAVLARIRESTARRKVRFTMKALQGLAALGVGLDEEDACDVLAHLDPSDFVERLASQKTGEWMYVFKPSVGGVAVYVKVVLRADCIVISFHEEEGHIDEDE